MCHWIPKHHSFWPCCLKVVFAIRKQGRTGVFSWCVIGWFYFLWNVMNLGNYSLWLVTWRFCVTLKASELLTDIRDFTTQFYASLRRKFSEWLECSIECDLSMRFTIWSLDLAIHDFAFFKHCFWCKNRSLKRVSYLLIFVISIVKRKFLYSWSVIRDPPVWPS